MKKKFLNTILVMVFFITNTLTVLADPLPPAPSGFPFDPDGTGDEEAVPIDHKIILLVLAGIIWSFLFFRNTLKKQTVTN
jgi:hypothetical protein